MMHNEALINILHLTDIHGTEFYFDKIRQEIITSDLIIHSGDITHFGREKEARYIVEIIKAYNKNLYAVPGNCDYPGVEEYLVSENISLHRRVISFKGITLAGLGGSLPCPGTTPFEYSEMEAGGWLAELQVNIGTDTPFVFVSHQPPYGTLNDDVGSGTHVGSHEVEKFVLNSHAIVCTTGHIHEGAGADTLAGCKIVNPGPFREGYYALIHINTKEQQLTGIQLKHAGTG
jgi:uncharacterized protein